QDDPEVAKSKATKEIARFVSLHPHSIAQKAAVMIEHFRQSVRHKIGGRAKAMVVTRSRLHAVRYKHAFDDYIKKMKYTDLNALIGIKAVQTLTRLNRICQGKEDTFVLDFVNTPDEIKEAFQPYYEVTGISEVTDPNVLYDFQYELDAMQVYSLQEVQQVNEL